LPIEKASWADWDTWDRLVFVRDGRLFAAPLSSFTLRAEELFDFNPFYPHELAAPDWAKRW
jgi:hypothetical protein